MIGGQSTTTNRDFGRSAALVFSISGEFAISTTLSPAARGGKRLSPGTSGTLIRTCFRGTACARTSFSPFSGDNPKVLAARGLRMSASSRHVSACSAKTKANLTYNMALPSPAPDETTRMTKLDCFVFAIRMEDFRLRTASACRDQGLTKVKTMSRFSAVCALTLNKVIVLCHPNHLPSTE